MPWSHCLIQLLVDSLISLWYVTRRYSRDMPWIKKHFRYLIRRRQFAWRDRLMTEYRRYRNQVQRAACRLRRNYYEKSEKSAQRDANTARWL